MYTLSNDQQSNFLSTDFYDQSQLTQQLVQRKQLMNKVNIIKIKTTN